MPVELSIRTSGETIYTCATGPVADGDIARGLTELLAHPGWRPGAAVIVSCCDLDLTDLSPSAIREHVLFSRSVEHRTRGSKVAIVAPQPAVFGLARMYQALRDPPFAFGVFRARGEAEAWVDARRR